MYCANSFALHTYRHYWIFFWDSYQLKSIRVITDGGETGCDGERGSLEKLDTRLVRDMNHLEKQLICELKGTQLEAKTVCKAAVKSAIIFPPCSCPKYSNWLLSFAFQTDKLVFLEGRSLFGRPAIAKDLVRWRWSPSSLPWRSIQPLWESRQDTGSLLLCAVRPDTTCGVGESIPWQGGGAAPSRQPGLRGQPGLGPSH